MNDQRWVVTGSLGGIGKCMVEYLAEQGANLILLNRGGARAEAQVSDLKSRFPNIECEYHTVDLLDAREIIQVGARVVAKHTRIHGLLNLAGFLSDERAESAQRLEGHFAVNTLAPYLLTRVLETGLLNAGTRILPSVVVNFSSGVVAKVKNLDVTALSWPDEIGGLMGAYANSKAALDAITALLDNKHKADNTLFISIDPGPTKTPMTDNNPGMPWIIRLIRPLLFKSVERQSKHILNAINMAQTQRLSGVYFSEGKQRAMPQVATNMQVQESLATLLEEIIVRTSEQVMAAK